VKVRSLLWLLCVGLACCNKSVDTVTGKKEAPADKYKTYFIPKGQHYATDNNLKVVKVQQMQFMAIFDSSCIYTSRLAENQLDINKLYGFSDCGSTHQVNSARIGWRWNGSAIELLAYCYVNSGRKSQLLGTVAINQPATLAIQVSAGQYIFACNGKTITLPRHCSGNVAEGYQLYPYFGGDETAPHDIRLSIKETGQGD
jgi:hypothetical protein